MSDPSEDSDENHHREDEHSGDSDADQRACHDDSDASQSDADDADPDADSDADSDAEPKFMNSRLLDLEAEEDNGSDDSDQESDDSGSRGSMDGFINRPESEEPRKVHFFPQFKRLPLEMRLRIWELFCPDLLADARVYSFTAAHQWSGPHWTPLAPDVHLGELTEAARTVLAVHQESRDFALRAFPDTFFFPGGVIPFNREKDIILLNNPYRSEMEPFDPVSASQMRNVALRGRGGSLFEELSECWRALDALRDYKGHLKNVYFVSESNLWDDGRLLSWCALKTNHQYRAETFEVEAGLGEDLEYIFAWPDLGNHPDFMREWRNALAEDDKGREWLEGVEPVGEEHPWADSADSHTTANTATLPIIQPLIDFTWDSGPRRFEKLVRMAESGTLDEYVTSDEESSEGEDEPNEYESEGIDDSDMEELEEHSQDEDDLVVIGDDSEDQGSDGGASTFGGFSPIQQTPSQAHAHGGTIDLTHDDDGANFSSPEPQDDDESQTVRESDSDEEPESRPRAAGKRSRSRVVESDDEDEVVELEEEDEPPRRHKRKRDMDSDDEEDDVIEIDDEDAAPRKRSRISNSRAGGSRNRTAIVIPGDDSEEEIRKTRENLRRSRAIIIDDDDDDDEDEEEHSSGRNTSESDEEYESEDVEEEEASRPLSLMERLELHRRDNPTPGASGDDGEGNAKEDPNIEEMGEDDYDARNYNHFEDDDERMELSTDDDLDQGGQIDFDSDGEGDGDGGYF